MSNTGMDIPSHLEQRLIDLEVKASFHEDQLDQLDQVIIRQQQQIDFLLRTIAELRHNAPDNGAPVTRNLRDDLPPHF